MVQTLWRTVWQFLKMINIHFLYESAIPFLGVYPREMKVYVHTKICTQIFLTALSIKARN